MSSGSKWFDVVVGVNVHSVIVPGTPNPVLLPHIYIGIVFDPLGLMLSCALGAGPVLINGLPAATAGTAVRILTPHQPTPPGVAFAPDDAADGEGTLISGSKTVSIGGFAAARAGSAVSTCSYPVNTPNASIIASSSVDVGGPEAVDGLAAVMAGIRTKAVSDAIHGFFRITPRTRISKLVCFLTGHPVDVMTGEVLTDHVDFELPGPLPLVFERNYYSRWEEPVGVLGPGWHHPFEVCVDEGELLLHVRLPDGRLAKHDPLEPGESEWRAQDRYTLARDAGGYTLTFADGTRYRCEPVPGARVSFPLASVSDRCGNAIVLQYRDGQLHDVIDSAGRHLRFLMRGDRLWAVRVLVKGDWQLLVRFRYHDDGFLAEVIDPAEQVLRYEYNGGVLVKETNRNGLSFHFEYDWYHPWGYCTKTWGDGGIYERKLTYHKYGFTCMVEDSRGGTTTYIGNGDGLVEREIDPMGIERWYEWNIDNRKSAEMDAHKNRTEWSYDERGNVVSIRDPLGHETRFAYNAMNLPEEMVDAAGVAWRWSYDTRGVLVRETEPLGNVTRFFYDRRGLLVRIEGPLGRSLALAYDDQGNLVTGERVYDELGRLVRHGELRFCYGRAGHLERVERTDGTWVRMKRDGEGNVVERVDEGGRTWRYKYAGMNRLVEQVDPEGGVVQLGYDREEDLVSVTNERGEKHDMLRDKAGRVKKEKGFDGRTAEFIHDQAGWLIRYTNAAKKWVDIERDKLGRAVRMQMPGRVPKGKALPEIEEVAFRYDERGDVVWGKSKAVETTLCRDALGRVVEELVGTVRVERVYDAAGELALRRTSLGHEARFAYDKRGGLEAMSFGYDARFGAFESLRSGELGLRAPWKATIERDEHGDEALRRLPGDGYMRWARDRFGRPAALRAGLRGATIQREYRWKSDDEIAAFGGTSFGHDLRGNLTWGADRSGHVEHRAVDEVGNVYRSAERDDRKYGPGGRLTEADGAQYVHDADGQLVAKRTADGKQWDYRWNALGQLIEVLLPDDRIVQFAYDAFGRRVAKRVEGEVRRFIWDGDELVHEVPEATPLVTWVFEPGTFAPLAKGEGERRYGVLADHLGVRLALVDEDGAPAWVGELDVWGEVWTQVDETANPWRFPGQYADDETALYYNRFRYYDPEVGRYISQDPIGLAGGLNLYAYVRDPWAWVDPLGLGPLLPNEGRVGTFEELWALRRPGDHLTPHHMPSHAYMQSLGVPGYSYDSGACFYMEQFSPGRGGRHRQTWSYGRQPALSLTPRQALAKDIRDLRRIYQADGLYGSRIRAGLLQAITLNKNSFQSAFQRPKGCK
ncbi:RHS repeat-associated core domain-containing protein [Polyangium mundeleinium]|uniref:DUF6531 domain-containing protein n=1 Tax=Polyangium mundeleinium TaxID=2995306 RepID=A0ABT5EJA8_9BACT|nr:RHS repeat-associated core domain-containing protein [Polyangium mundeleinium]MDC0740845.1 DUF6531 domain-containing protein [Polyangium mundeleinium]